MSKVLVKICFLAILCIPLQAQAKNNKTDNDISYRVGAERCALDIAYDSDRKEAPVIVWFHGGGLTKGNKKIPEKLRGKNCVVVSVGYRLYPEASVSEIIDDAAMAVAWVVNNISRYGGDTHKIILSGHSAGAYLVSMLALDKQHLSKYGVDADQFSLIAPFAGQMMTHFTEKESRGIEKTQPVIDSLAPLYHIRKDAPPFLLVTGDRNLEMICRYEENALFCGLMKHIGHPSMTLYELQGFTHKTMVQPALQLLVNTLKL